MLNGDLFLFTSPFIIIILALCLLYILTRIKRKHHRWEFDALALIPIAFIFVYGWIGILDPPIELARLWNRLVLMFSFGVGICVALTYLLSLKRRA